MKTQVNDTQPKTGTSSLGGTRRSIGIPDLSRVHHRPPELHVATTYNERKILTMLYDNALIILFLPTPIITNTYKCRRVF